MLKRTGIEFLPERTDTAALKELAKQRFRWNKFLSKSQVLGDISIWEDGSLWHHRLNILNPKQQSTFKYIERKFPLSSHSRKIKKLKFLIRQGVPPELRGSVWWACSAASKTKESFIPSYYADIVSDLENQKGITAYNDIIKDLSRTFSAVLATMDKHTSAATISMAHSRDTVISSDECSYVSIGHSLSIDDSPQSLPCNTSESFLAALERVLLAYAVHNRRVGYCQSMNYICALLLFHVRDEEKVFWMLATIVEDICSNYYLPTFIGVRTDNIVLQALLAHYSPKLFAHFKATDTILEPIIMPWFLCLYINALPNYAVCRVWDCIFWQGREVLFRVALHLLNSKSKLIREVDDFASVYSILKSENMGSENSFTLESPSKRRNIIFGNLSQNMNSLSTYQIPFSKRPRGTVSGYAFAFGLEENNVQDISTAEHLITATFAERLIFIRSKVYSLRSTIMQHLCSMDKMQRNSSSQSRPTSTEIIGQGLLDTAGQTSGLSLQEGVIPEFEGTLPTPFRDTSKCEKLFEITPPAASSNASRFTSVEFVASGVLREESRRQSESFVRINSSTGTKTAFFTAPRMIYTQRMSFRSDPSLHNNSMHSESFNRIGSSRNESCYRIPSTSSRAEKEKHLSLIRLGFCFRSTLFVMKTNGIIFVDRVLTEEDLSIEDIHCLGLELQEEFEMDVGKLVRGMGMKKMKSEASIQHEAIVEEYELQQEIEHSEDYEDEKE